ncbi:hypothetical protein [Thomasclavelia cocleata]|uniref:hypothetical protein n=1 Tax=Thomasclavelia cocleata TaxID=69824 RepID=UPI00272EE1B9|nr:hypothetical protein [Thomasclavelia cocleata]
MEQKTPVTALGKPNKSHLRRKNDDFIEKECEIIKYDNRKKILDIQFDKYGIRIYGVTKININVDSMVKVKYKGKIGEPNFIIKV